jgi:hypothetical protein
MSTRIIPSSVGIRPSYDNSPLSSPHLPHPPQLPHTHPSDIWIPPPFVVGHHRIPQMVPSAGPHYQHHTPFPRGIPPVPPPSPDSAHMLQRGGMHQRPTSDIFVPNMGMKQQHDAHAYGMGNGNPPYHKRWSVPSFPQGGQPLYPHHQSQTIDVQQQQQQWGAWPKQGVVGNRAMGGNINGQRNGQYSGFNDTSSQGKQHGNQAGGGSLSMSDPWSSHWTVPPGGPGFPPPPGPMARYNGLSIPPSTQGSGGKEKRSKTKTGRSVSCVAEPWSALKGMEVGVASHLEGKGAVAAAGSDLLQLMRSLDISSEHMQSLKVRICMCVYCVCVCVCAVCVVPV